MRLVLLALVLANMLLAAYGFRMLAEPGPNAALQSQQLQPERIRLIGPEEAERMAAAKKVSAPCLEWGAFPVADAAKAAEALESLGVKARERRVVEDAARWWVTIPPLANRAAANARLAELKKLGIEELYVIDDDAAGLRNGISLGLFRGEDGARQHLDALARRGVAGARVVAREPVVRVYLQVREAPEGLRGRAAELRGAWPAAELRECPADPRT
jgi:hypothetical protein